MYPFGLSSRGMWKCDSPSRTWNVTSTHRKQGPTFPCEISFRIEHQAIKSRREIGFVWEATDCSVPPDPFDEAPSDGPVARRFFAAPGAPATPVAGLPSVGVQDVSRYLASCREPFCQSDASDLPLLLRRFAKFGVLVITAGDVSGFREFPALSFPVAHTIKICPNLCSYS